MANPPASRVPVPALLAEAGSPLGELRIALATERGVLLQWMSGSRCLLQPQEADSHVRWADGSSPDAGFEQTIAKHRSVLGEWVRSMTSLARVVASPHDPTVTAAFAALATWQADRVSATRPEHPAGLVQALQGLGGGGAWAGAVLEVASGDLLPGIDGSPPRALALAKPLFLALWGRRAEALTALSELGACAKGSAEHDATCALLALFGDDGRRCVEHRRTLLELMPGTQRLLQAASAELAAGNVERAIATAKRAAGDSPVEAAELLRRAGAVHEAARVLEQAHHEGVAGVAGPLAEFELRAGRIERAVKLAGEVDSDTPLHHRVLGIAEAYGSRYEPALERFCQATTLDPGDFESRVWTMLMLARLGRVEEARLASHRTRSVWASTRLIRLTVLRKGDGGSSGLSEIDEIPELCEQLHELCGPELAQAVADRDLPALKRLAEIGLEKLGQDLSEQPTQKVSGSPGSLEPAPVGPSLRTLCENAQLGLQFGTPEQVLAEFSTLEMAYPGSPHPVAYSAEVLLWLGRYEEALGRFESVISGHPSARWGYVGTGAALALLNRPQEAARVWARGHDPIVTEASYVYRAHAELSQGEPGKAESLLEHGVKHRPSRVGAWLALAKARDQLGKSAAAVQARDEARRLAPSLLTEASAPGRTLTDQVERALEMSRGNRGSTQHTYFDPGNVFRVVIPRDSVDGYLRSGHLERGVLKALLEMAPRSEHR